MPGGESQRHRMLKQAGIQWLAEHDYAIQAMEVRLPNSGFRADVVGYQSGWHEIGHTVVIECKQARSDFLKDTRSAADALKRLKDLHRRRMTLEKLLHMHYPSLRRGDSLFPEYETVDLTRLEHRSYKQVMREIALLENRVHHKTKFEKIARYQCANLCYLAVLPDIIEPHELPSAWGLLELREERLHLIRKPQFLDIPASRRLEMLHLIARAATSRLHRQLMDLPSPLRK